MAAALPSLKSAVFGEAVFDEAGFDTDGPNYPSWRILIAAGPRAGRGRRGKVVTPRSLPPFELVLRSGAQLPVGCGRRGPRRGRAVTSFDQFLGTQAAPPAAGRSGKPMVIEGGQPRRRGRTTAAGWSVPLGPPRVLPWTCYANPVLAAPAAPETASGNIDPWRAAPAF